jgi:hypothetical protein
MRLTFAAHVLKGGHESSDWEKARVLGFVLYIEGISIARDRRPRNMATRP